MPSRNEASIEVRREKSRQPGERLALLYQSLFIGIVRMQTGRQHLGEAEEFRRRTKAALQDIERNAISTGFIGEDIQETHFAVIAFLDAVILNSRESIRAEWERKPLQEELFGKSDAGVVFFEKLERFRSRRDSRHLADILEVFLLCLLLGFEGRYAGGLRGELHSITDRLRTRIHDIRGNSRQLAPAATPLAVDRPMPTRQRRREPRYVAIMLSAVFLTLLLLAAAKANLIWTADAIRSSLF